MTLLLIVYWVRLKKPSVFSLYGARRVDRKFKVPRLP